MDEDSFKPFLSAVFASVDSPLRGILTSKAWSSNWRGRSSSGLRELILVTARTLCLRHAVSVTDAQLWTIQATVIDTAVRLECDAQEPLLVDQLVGLHERGDKAGLRDRNQHHIDPSALKQNEYDNLDIRERHRRALELARFAERLMDDRSVIHEVIMLLMPELLDKSWHEDIERFRIVSQRQEQLDRATETPSNLVAQKVKTTPFPPGFECISSPAHADYGEAHSMSSNGVDNADQYSSLRSVLDPFQRAHVMLSALMDFAGNVALLSLFVSASWKQQSNPLQHLDETPIVTWMHDSSETCHQLLQLGDEACRGGHMQTATEFYTDALRHAFADPGDRSPAFVLALLREGWATSAKGLAGTVPRTVRALMACSGLQCRVPRSRFHAAVEQLPYLTPYGQCQMWSDARFVLCSESPGTSPRGSGHTFFIMAKGLLETAAERLCKYDRVNSVALWLRRLRADGRLLADGPSELTTPHRSLKCLKDKVRERWADERGGKALEGRLDFGAVTRSIQRRSALYAKGSAAAHAEEILLEDILGNAAAHAEDWMRCRRGLLQSGQCGTGTGNGTTVALT